MGTPTPLDALGQVYAVSEARGRVCVLRAEESVPGRGRGAKVLRLEFGCVLKE